MQLAKNLFLTQTKSLARKFEEVVLAWLMENFFKISKDRILEIYLNIIEFGENIYGLSEAAQFYFEKKVSELDITESLVLSYIIPRPKYFLEALLIKSPKLIQNLTKHIYFHSKYLLARELIDEESYNQVQYSIIFKPSIGTLVLKRK
jgi:membrane peptidoglycan carboxypeptidase